MMTSWKRARHGDDGAAEQDRPAAATGCAPRRCRSGSRSGCRPRWTSPSWSGFPAGPDAMSLQRAVKFGLQETRRADARRALALRPAAPSSRRSIASASDQIEQRAAIDAPSAAQRLAISGGRRHVRTDSATGCMRWPSSLSRERHRSGGRPAASSASSSSCADGRGPVLLAVDAWSARPGVRPVGRPVIDDLAGAQADDARQEHLRQRHVVDIDDGGELRSAQISAISRMIWREVFGSRLAVGSSTSSSSGSCSSARAMPTRWRWPPDSASARLSTWSMQADAIEQSRRRCRTSAWRKAAQQSCARTAT